MPVRRAWDWLACARPARVPLLRLPDPLIRRDAQALAGRHELVPSSLELADGVGEEGVRVGVLLVREGNVGVGKVVRQLCKHGLRIWDRRPCPAARHSVPLHGCRVVACGQGAQVVIAVVAIGETEVRGLDPEDLDQRLFDELDLVVEVVVR